MDELTLLNACLDHLQGDEKQVKFMHNDITVEIDVTESYSTPTVTFQSKLDHPNSPELFPLVCSIAEQICSETTNNDACHVEASWKVIEDTQGTDIRICKATVKDFLS